jgi:proteasome lid subunit RPN8/RPN11
VEIKVKGRSPAPTEHPPPGERRGTVIIDPGLVNSPLPVYIDGHVLKAMKKYARSGGDYEVGGFLLGGYHHFQGHQYIDITAQVAALKAGSARTHLKFTNEAQREFHAVKAARYPKELVLGWYHTHPAYGVFLSEYDMFIQRGFFADEHMCAVVIDAFQMPRDQVGVFTWTRGDVSNGYHLIVYVQE